MKKFLETLAIIIFAIATFPMVFAREVELLILGEDKK